MNSSQVWRKGFARNRYLKIRPKICFRKQSILNIGELSAQSWGWGASKMLLVCELRHYHQSKRLGHVRILKGTAIFRYPRLSHLPQSRGCTNVLTYCTAQAGLPSFHSC